jgi:hypothetical protein
MTQPLEPLRMLATLRSNGADFVLVGGLAGAVRGGPIDTDDVDICIPRDDDNYRRLALALRQMAAVPIGEDAADRSSYATSWGPIDMIELGEEFDSFYARATDEDLGNGVRCRVASADDMIHLKRLSGDLATVVNLVSLQEQARTDGPDAPVSPARVSYVHEDEFGPMRDERGGPRWLSKMMSRFEDIDDFMSRVVYGDEDAHAR